jgi:phage terminase large subunit-like protein
MSCLDAAVPAEVIFRESAAPTDVSCSLKASFAALDRIVQSWDTANKASELSDFSVCTSWGIKGKDIYLLHVLRKRMEYPELKRAVREQCAAFAANVVLIEDKASGTQLIQELIEQGVHAVTRYQPQADKIMRMHAQTR